MSDGHSFFDPATLSEEAFLIGPDRFDHDDEDADADDILDVDDIFAKDFDRVLREQRQYDAASLEIAPDALRTETLNAPGYAIVGVEAGLLLLDGEGTPCGGYVGCDVSIASEHQGQGLGSELILEMAMRSGGLPTWWLDQAAYSNAGVEAHRAAHRLALDRGFFARKLESLEAAANRAAEMSADPAP